MTVLHFNKLKDNVNAVSCLLVFAVVIASVLFVNSSITNNVARAAMSQTKFNKDDFMIKDFGIGDDGYPFITVVGQAGGTIPDILSTGYAYVFVTDKGTYAVSSDWMYPKWHTHELTLNEKNCITSMNMNVGGADISDAVKVTKTNATKLVKAITAEFTLNNLDGSICATKIFDSTP